MQPDQQDIPLHWNQWEIDFNNQFNQQNQRRPVEDYENVHELQFQQPNENMPLEDLHNNRGLPFGIEILSDLWHSRIDNFVEFAQRLRANGIQIRNTVINNPYYRTYLGLQAVFQFARDRGIDLNSPAETLARMIANRGFQFYQNMNRRNRNNRRNFIEPQIYVGERQNRQFRNRIPLNVNGLQDYIFSQRHNNVNQQNEQIVLNDELFQEIALEDNINQFGLPINREFNNNQLYNYQYNNQFNQMQNTYGGLSKKFRNKRFKKSTYKRKSFPKTKKINFTKQQRGIPRIPVLRGLGAPISQEAIYTFHQHGMKTTSFHTSTDAWTNCIKINLNSPITWVPNNNGAGSLSYGVYTGQNTRTAVATPKAPYYADITTKYVYGEVMEVTMNIELINTGTGDLYFHGSLYTIDGGEYQPTGNISTPAILLHEQNMDSPYQQYGILPGAGSGSGLQSQRLSLAANMRTLTGLKPGDNKLQWNLNSSQVPTDMCEYNIDMASTLTTAQAYVIKYHLAYKVKLKETSPIGATQV